MIIALTFKEDYKANLTDEVKRKKNQKFLKNKYLHLLSNLLC